MKVPCFGRASTAKLLRPVCPKRALTLYLTALLEQVSTARAGRMDGDSASFSIAFCARRDGFAIATFRPKRIMHPPHELKASTHVVQQCRGRVGSSAFPFHVHESSFMFLSQRGRNLMQCVWRSSFRQLTAALCHADVSEDRSRKTPVGRSGS